jgi:hypothetical protein
MLSSCLDGIRQDVCSGKTLHNNNQQLKQQRRLEKPSIVCFYVFFNTHHPVRRAAHSFCRSLAVCPPDLGWITTWLSVGHIQVAVLLSFLARSVYGNPNEEVKLSHLVSTILCIEITVGMFSRSHLHRPFLLMQLLVWTVQLACLQWFTYAEYDEPLRLQQQEYAPRYGGLTPTSRELLLGESRIPKRNNINSSRRSLMTSGGPRSAPGTPGWKSGLATPTNSSNEKSLRIGGFAVVSIALGVVTVGSLIQTMELVMLEGKTSYYVGSSSSIRYVST